MGQKKNTHAGSKVFIIVLSIFCILLIGVSIVNSDALSPLRQAGGVLVTPIEKGISSFGSWAGRLGNSFTDTDSLRSENEDLKSQVEALQAENSQLVLDKEELNRLQKLMDLKEESSDYETTGARAISKGSGNWFSEFTIDKGSSDGIKVNCNVISGSGLVGIVTKVGPNWATVRSIIDDDSNVSAMVSTTSDTCIIAGNLELIDTGVLSLVQLTDTENKVHVGDKVVTSDISEKYLPGILIGYISELNNNPNNLSKSGQLTPVVDFRHIQEVLVILKTKDYVASPDDSSSNVVDDVTGAASAGTSSGTSSDSTGTSADTSSAAVPSGGDGSAGSSGDTASAGTAGSGTGGGGQ